MATPMDRLDDLQVYRKLHAVVEELDGVSNRSMSPAAATAIEATTKLVRALASGLYKQSIEAMAETVKN